MATSPIPTWAREQSPYHRGPTGAGVLLLALVVVLVVLLASAWPTTEGGPVAGDTDRGSLCDQHRDDPAWRSICREATGR
jgi:hypothetical protein